MRRHTFVVALSGSLVAGLIPVSVHAAEPCIISWDAALELQQQGDSLGAAQAYADILADCPESQRALVMRAACNLAGGVEASTALSDLDAAFQIDGFNFWAEVGLYYKVKACRAAGCLAESQDAITILRERFPASFSLARAEALNAAPTESEDTSVPRRVMDGGGMSEEMLDEEQANGMLDGATHDDAMDDEDQLAAIQVVIDTFPNSKAAIRARDAKCHLLVRLKRGNEAIEEFEGLLSLLGESSSRSQLAETTRTRLSALYHKARRMDEAYMTFLDLRDTARNPAVRSNAALQAAGVYFETQQAVSWSRNRFDYDTVRRLCSDVQDLGFASTEEVARAKLMTLETYQWEKNPTQCLSLAEAFLDEYGASELHQELVTAHLFAGESLQILNRRDEAYGHYQWIITQCDGAEPWAGLETLARIHYRVFNLLSSSNANPAEIRAAAQYVLSQFPDTKYADLVTNAAKQGFWKP